MYSTYLFIIINTHLNWESFFIVQIIIFYYFYFLFRMRKIKINSKSMYQRSRMSIRFYSYVKRLRMEPEEETKENCRISFWCCLCTWHVCAAQPNTHTRHWFALFRISMHCSLFVWRLNQHYYRDIVWKKKGIEWSLHFSCVCVCGCVRRQCRQCFIKCRLRKIIDNYVHCWMRRCDAMHVNSKWILDRLQLHAVNRYG